MVWVVNPWKAYYGGFTFNKNYGAPKSSILLGCSIINHPQMGVHKLEPPPSFPLSRSIDATPEGHGHGSVQPFAEARLSATKAEETKITWQVSNERTSDGFFFPGMIWDDWSRKKTSYGLNTRDDGLTCFFFIRWDVFHVAIIPPGMMIDDPQWFENDNQWPYFFKYFFRDGTTK